MVLKLAKPPRKAKSGEVINGQPTTHGQYIIVEVEWGKRKQGTRVDEYEFDTTTPLCSRVVSECTKSCQKRHTDFVNVNVDDVILPPLDLQITMQNANNRRCTKRVKAKEQVKKGRLETWALPAGTKQKLMQMQT